MTIYCFSGSGHSMAVANGLCQLLECSIKPVGLDGEEPPEEDTAIVVFPVYCQNIPSPVKNFLKKLQAAHIVLIATYGKVSYGNVLYEGQKLLRGEVIAGAYIPMGHTFLNGDCTFDKACLLPIVDRIKAPQRAYIPKTRKNPLANIFPALRSRMGVKLIRTGLCGNCGLCEKCCPVGAIQNGRVSNACIRCLRCKTNCPENALTYKNSRILQAYLKHYYKDEFVIYL